MPNAKSRMRNGTSQSTPPLKHIQLSSFIRYQFILGLLTQEFVIDQVFPVAQPSVSPTGSTNTFEHLFSFIS